MWGVGIYRGGGNGGRTNGNGAGRDQLAGQVVFWSGLGIATISVAVVAAVALRGDPKNIETTLTTVFNTLVPLFGTWVGTVLAFYFSSKNYEAAAKATKDLVGQLGDDRLKQIPIKDAWIPASGISGLPVDDGKESTVDFVKDVEGLLNTQISRVPVWDANKVVRYVLHESMVYRFLAKNKKPDPTLQDFLDFAADAGTYRDIVSKIGWVSQTATLADAKAKMEGTPNCQDVFVTASGSNIEPVLGWVTNVEIAKKSKP